MLSRRRLLAGAGGALAAGVFAAGGGVAGARRPSLARAAARAAGRPRSGDLPTLSQWYHTYGEEGVQDAVNGYAAAYTEAEVSVEWVPDPYESTLTSALLTDDGPDVFEYGNGPSIDMIQAGQVLPLDDVLGDAAADFNQTLLQRLTYDGHLYAIPQALDMQLLIYRKSLLEEAGIEPPVTLDDLVAAAAALTTGDVKGIFLGNDGGAGVMAGMPLWAAVPTTSPRTISSDSRPTTVYESFAKLQELYQSDSLLLGAPTEWHSPGAFISELTAMQWTGLWTFPEILASGIADDFGVLPWPKLAADTGAQSVPFGAFASTVSAGTADPDAAKAFVRWLWVDQTESQVDFATSYGFHVPVARQPAGSGRDAVVGPRRRSGRGAQRLRVRPDAHPVEHRVG